jgi:fructokinase
MAFNPMHSSLLIFGEVLWDCFPDGKRILGGAPFNVAWHLRALGEQPLLISRVGLDAAGHEIQHRLQAWGLNSIGLQQDREHSTGQVTVTFDDDEPQYHIRENCAYDFIDISALPTLPPQSLLYHGTLALRHPVSHKALQYIVQNYAPKVFLDVNLRAPYWDLATVTQRLATTTYLKLNEQELALLCPQENTITQRANFLLARYPLEIMTVTQGAKGAILFQSQQDPILAKPQPGEPVVDTVGAGDALSSGLLLGLLKGWPHHQTLIRAQQLARAIVAQQGAIVTDPTFYQDLLEDWGKD